LYKFKQLAADNIDINTGELVDDPFLMLLTQIEYMVNVLRRYQCEPIIVFDGKPPKEKEETLEERQIVKKAAQSKKNVYKQMLQQRSRQLSSEDRKSLCDKLIVETKKSISINKQDIEGVKELIETLRVKYIQCEGEADNVCIELVRKGQAWAVMSDDTDFIAQCCKRVLRNVDFEKQRYDFVNTQTVLFSLNIKPYEFKCICVLAGCDYFKLEIENNKKINIFSLYDYYCKFAGLKEKRNQEFLRWLSKYIKINISEIDQIINTHMK
jgi:hypothetical protein